MPSLTPRTALMMQQLFIVAAVICFALAGLLLWCDLAHAQEAPAPVKESRLFRGLGVAYLCLGGADAAQARQQQATPAAPQAPVEAPKK